MADYLDPAWPPGTVKLAQLLAVNETESDIILQPRPTNDPNDPLNWPRWQKAINYTLACFYATMVYAFVNATSPTWGPMGEELNFSSTLLTNTYAIGCATLALGAPMLIPFALKFGSRSVYVFSSAAQLGVSIWSARTQTPGDWWGVNALQCWLGSLCEVLVQLTIADVYFVHQRGLMNSIYIWAMNVGGNLAVVAAGFATTSMGWRWVWWWFVIFFGLQLVVFIFGFEETKFRLDEATLVGQKPGSESPSSATSPSRAEDQEKKTTKNVTPVVNDTEANRSDTRNLSVVHIDHTIPRKTYRQKLSLTTTSPGNWLQFLRHSWQPFLILGSIPGVMYSSLVYAILLAWSTVQTAALSTIMLDAPYNFSASQIGLMSLAPFIGQTLGSLICGPLSDWTVLYLARRNNGIYEPEFRFYLFVPFVPFQLAGAWWFGYALNNGSSWEQVAVAYGVCTFGMGPLQSVALTYMLDAYNEIVGDALTALTFVRNTFSTIFVFAMPAWIAAVGIANVFNMIGAFGAVILLFSVVLIWKGKQLRVRTTKVYRYYASRQFEGRPL
ncbi:major facilitator superfamily transporter like protein [Zymoseptoria brevis]|uniref:Major facilitator superfamily transporter like protein n=1 Tax=Zymoseptoria brevis TaxID=1047168 RepID=A0A0F4G5L3_9PEZI|nr:major facilitator superfamily transporter like protein [Zymoseptoria brevis]